MNDDSRRDFLLRFAGAAIAASGAAVDTPSFAAGPQERGPVAVYGPPPRRAPDPREAAYPFIILFASGQTELSPEIKAALDGQAEFLRQTRAGSIIVKAHADDPGSREKNLEISERRGEAVKRYLIAAGVPKDKIDVFPMGRERPADLGGGDDAKATNRRVEIVLTQW